MITIEEAALFGYEAEAKKIREKIAELQRQLNGRGPARRAGLPGAENPLTGRPRRAMSASARRRIAAAQKKRWAEFRKTKKGA